MKGLSGTADALEVIGLDEPVETFDEGRRDALEYDAPHDLECNRR
jgi:hypothetical protein